MISIKISGNVKSRKSLVKIDFKVGGLLGPQTVRVSGTAETE